MLTADMKQATISAPKLARLVGCSYRQIDHWVRVGLLDVHTPARGSGTHRGFSLDDALFAGAFCVLHHAGAPITVPAGGGEPVANPAIRRFADNLRNNPTLWNRTVVIAVDGHVGTGGNGWSIDLPQIRAAITAGFAEHAGRDTAVA